MKQRIITTILTGMENHKYDVNIIKNGLINFRELRIPQDVVSIILLITIISMTCFVGVSSIPGLSHNYITKNIVYFIILNIYV